jgi:hypothetical protein
VKTTLNEGLPLLALCSDSDRRVLGLHLFATVIFVADIVIVESKMGLHINKKINNEKKKENIPPKHVV